MYVVRKHDMYYLESLDGSGMWVRLKAHATVYDFETACFVANLRDGKVEEL